MSDTAARPLTHEQRGRLGARTRWGDTPRVVRLHDLTPDQRRLVLALVEAARNAQADKQAA